MAKVVGSSKDTRLEVLWYRKEGEVHVKHDSDWVTPRDVIVEHASLQPVASAIDTYKLSEEDRVIAIAAAAAHSSESDSDAELL